MIIRDERPEEDAAAVRALLEAAFGGPLEAELVDRLRQDGDVVLGLVAEEAGRVVGHVLLSRMTAPFRALALAPLAVLPERQRTGIGGRLVRAALARATAEDFDAVIVVGEPAYYQRLGFDAALARGFLSPYAGPFLMARALRGALPVATGRLAHAPAFAALEP
jgi:putative acetyltransferase